MKITIRKEEIFRYAAAQGLEQDPFWEAQADKAIAMTEAQLRPRFCYRCFSISQETDGVSVKNTALFLQGQDIKKHVKGAQSCYLLAATLGHGMETLLRHTMATDMTLGLLLDACADVAIESLCDSICEDITKELPCGVRCTTRYSPGYGDFPLSVQPDFLKALDATKRIGLHVSPDLILLPRKSVTAVIGVTTGEKETLVHGCAHCANRQNCSYKKC